MAHDESFNTRNRRQELANREMARTPAELDLRAKFRLAEDRYQVWNLDQMEDSLCAPTNWIPCKVEDHEGGLPQLGIYVMAKVVDCASVNNVDQKGCELAWVFRSLCTEDVPNNRGHYVWKGGHSELLTQDVSHWAHIDRPY